MVYKKNRDFLSVPGSGETAFATTEHANGGSGSKTRANNLRLSKILSLTGSAKPPTPDPPLKTKASPFFRFGWGGFSAIFPWEFRISQELPCSRPPCGFPTLSNYCNFGCNLLHPFLVTLLVTFLLLLLPLFFFCFSSVFLLGDRDY